MTAVMTMRKPSGMPSVAENTDGRPTTMTVKMAGTTRPQVRSRLSPMCSDLMANLLLGWTVVGWFVLLYAAMAGSGERSTTNRYS